MTRINDPEGDPRWPYQYIVNRQEYERLVRADLQCRDEHTRLRDALERLVAVADAATMIWTDSVPPDAMPGGALHNAKELLTAIRLTEPKP